jgi:hypothetical protein
MENRAEVEDRSGSAGWGVHFFLDEYYLNPTLYNLAKKGGYLFDFWGRVLLRFEVGLGLGSFFGVSWSSYLQSYLESFPNPT